MSDTNRCLSCGKAVNFTGRIGCCSVCVQGSPAERERKKVEEHGEGRLVKELSAMTMKYEKAKKSQEVLHELVEAHRAMNAAATLRDRAGEGIGGGPMHDRYRERFQRHQIAMQEAALDYDMREKT